MIKAGGRPLTMAFAPGGGVMARKQTPAGIAVTFTQPGTLGLKFTPNKQTGNVEVIVVNPGTQAEQHTQLQTGLILTSVAGASVSGKDYREVIEMIKAGGRPLTMAFAPGGSVVARSTSSSSSSVASPRQLSPQKQAMVAVAKERDTSAGQLHQYLVECPSDECKDIVARLQVVQAEIQVATGATRPPASKKTQRQQRQVKSADPLEGVTGKAAQQALQQHIMTQGTSDMKTIDRRQSLQADAAPGGQSAQAAQASAMAAVMEEIDDDEEEEEDEPPAGSVAVTFTEQGTLGLKFTPNKQTGNIELLAVNPGTQAERHPQLKGGLILRSVSGASTAGKDYQQVLGTIKAGGCPLDMVFTPGGTVAASPRPRASKKPSPRQAPAAVDPEAGLTGKAAQQALQDHIMKSGTGDVKKIDRLRRASLQPDLQSSGGQAAQMDEAAMMATAMEEIDEDDDDDQPSQARLEIESLYGKYNPEKLGDVGQLISKYGEDSLLRMVRKKYREQEQESIQPQQQQLNSEAARGRGGLVSQTNFAEGSVRVRVATWNCGNFPPDASLSDLISAGPDDGTHDDIFVLGLQESVVNQTGASVGAGSKAKQIAKGAIGITSALDQFWIDAVAETLGDGWRMVSLQTLGEMRLLVWAKTHIQAHISDLETASEACGIGGVVGNKGGLVSKFKVKDTSLCFISVHLAAHEGEKMATKRNADIREILAGARVGSMQWMDATTQFDHCWFIGDMNYRIDLQQLDGVSRSKKQHIGEVMDKIVAEEWTILQRADQLARELSTHRVLVGFDEGPLDYAPTFKVEREPGLNYGHKRVPSYCDRILFRSLPGLSDNLTQRWVQPVASVATSDHKPVVSLHDLHIQAPPPAMDQGGAHSNAYIEITGLHANRLTAMDANGKSDPYIKFHGAVLAGKVKQTKVIKGSVDPRWDNKQVPTLDCGNMQLSEICICKMGEAEKHVDLLLLEEGANSHYCWIKNFSRFARQPSDHKHCAKHYCHYCMIS